MKLLKYALKLFALLQAFMQPQALAMLSNPQVQPAQVNIALGRSARIPLVWRLTTNAGPAVSSSSGLLLGGSTVFMTVNRGLSVPAVNAGTDPATGQSISQAVSLRETLIIPAWVVEQAYSRSVTQLVYQRQFSDADGSLSATLVLNITGASAAGFNIDHLRLRFKDGSLRHMVERGDRLQAQAVVGFSGSGQLRGIWEIADPTSSAGKPVFRNLRLVQRTLPAGQAMTLDSPLLPTDRAGLYRLRLRLTRPALNVDFPQLQYLVRERTRSKLQNIDLLEPRDGARLGRDTNFRWQPLPGANLYRLEIRASERTDDAAGDEPITGMLVSGQQHTARLTAVLRRHLQAGEHYRWRLIAIDSAGRIIGRSPDRFLRL